MTDIIKPGAGILFMKVGTHAKESLSDIIKRKTQEIRDEGYALWGYGGSTCHPRTMVQPFAEEFSSKGQTIYLCMHEMASNHFAEPLRAKRFSIDGTQWDPIPEKIKALGSRYALVIEDLHVEDQKLPLNRTRVAIGPSRGRAGNNYIQGRADKGCFEVMDSKPEIPEEPSSIISIGLVAKLKKPYAVFLRGD